MNKTDQYVYGNYFNFKLFILHNAIENITCRKVNAKWITKKIFYNTENVTRTRRIGKQMGELLQRLKNIL